jgi:peptidoglycan/xylan/chitin deacetylase (PgdA/CDA1 family)
MSILLSKLIIRGLGPLAAGRNRLSILIYHRVLQESDPMRPDEVDAATFDRQMQMIAGGFNVIALDEAVERLQMRSLPPRAASITFDDGYADNLTVAAPILRRYGLTATFFIAAGYLDGGRMWNDSVIESVAAAEGSTIDLESLGIGQHQIGTQPERLLTACNIINILKYRPSGERADLVERIVQLVGASMPDDLMMTSSQLRELRDSGMSIGGHTVSHPILARLDEQTARQEIGKGRELLEAIIGERIHLFAYPNGKPRQDFRPEHLKLVQESGFRAAVTTSWGTATNSSDLFQLPRFLPWDKTPVRFATRLALNWFRAPELVV